MNPPVAVTIAGTDSGGAAGIAADLTTFAALGVHGACVVTAVTAQDTTGVHAIHPVPVATVRAQVDAVLEDLPVGAVKTGMLASPEAVVCLSQRISAASGTRPTAGARLPVVVDPVLVATSGAVLGDEAVLRAYLDHLLDLATVITPNLDEARALAAAAGLDPERPPAELAAALSTLGPAVVLTGGNEPVDGACVEWLALPGRPPVPARHPRVPTDNDHGTGCTYSAALAAHLARGLDLEAAARAASSYVVGQLHQSSDWTLGRGRGPVAHTINPTQGDA